MTNTVVCQACSAPIYRCNAIGREWAGAKVQASDMEPVSDDVPAPEDGDDMICPKCGEPFPIPNSENSFVLLLADGSYWPFPPRTFKFVVDRDQQR